MTSSNSALAVSLLSNPSAAPRSSSFGAQSDSGFASLLSQASAARSPQSPSPAPSSPGSSPRPSESSSERAQSRDRSSAAASESTASTASSASAASERGARHDGDRDEEPADSSGLSGAPWMAASMALIQQLRQDALGVGSQPLSNSSALPGARLARDARSLSAVSLSSTDASTPRSDSSASTAAESLRSVLPGSASLESRLSDHFSSEDSSSGSHRSSSPASDFAALGLPPALASLSSSPVASPIASGVPALPSAPVLSFESASAFAESSARLFARMGQDGVQSAVLQAQPEALGPIRASIEFDPRAQSVSSVSLSVATTEALALAQSHLSKLQESLGLSGSSIHIQLDSSLQFQTQAAAPMSGSADSSSTGSFSQEGFQQRHAFGQERHARSRDDSFAQLFSSEGESDSEQRPLSLASLRSFDRYA